MNREEVDRLATAADVAGLGLECTGIDDMACALLGFQRTKQISRRARLAWTEGDPAPLRREVAARRDEIVDGAVLEIYREYLPLKTSLQDRTVDTVCDIGCGQAINGLFLLRAYAPRFTLVDIEATESQYHAFAETGSGYASLASARALLIANGCDDRRIATVNPDKTDWQQTGHGFDLVTSLYSCGFHYPVDVYLPLFLDTVAAGGAVVLDLRRRYMKRQPAGLRRLLDAARSRTVYDDERSVRTIFEAP